MMRTLARLLLPAGGLLASSLATVQPAFAASGEAEARAVEGSVAPEASASRQLFREASSAAESGQWQVALDLYQQAYVLYPHATTLYNIGYCHGQLGKPARALFYTTRALDPRAFELDRRLAADREATARAFQKLLFGRVGRVTLSVASKRPFLLKVDGAAPVPLGAAEGNFVAQPDASEAHEDRVFLERVTLHLDPGSHELVVYFEGHTYARSIEVQAGEAVSIAWSPAPDTAAPARPAPSVVPAAPRAVPAEGTRATKHADGHTDSRALAPAGEASVYRPLAISSFVVGGAGLGLALVSGVVALSSHNDLEAVCKNNECGEEESETVERYQTAAQLTNVGLWTGAIGGALGVGFLLLDRDAEGAKLSLVLQPSRVQLQGSF